MKPLALPNTSPSWQLQSKTCFTVYDELPMAYHLTKLSVFRGIGSTLRQTKLVTVTQSMRKGLCHWVRVAEKKYWFGNFYTDVLQVSEYFIELLCSVVTLDMRSLVHRIWAPRLSMIKFSKSPPENSHVKRSPRPSQLKLAVSGSLLCIHKLHIRSIWVCVVKSFW